MFLDYAYKYTRLFDRNNAGQMAFLRTVGLPQVSVFGGQGIPVLRTMKTEVPNVVLPGNTLVSNSVLGAGNTPWTSPQLSSLVDPTKLSQQLAALTSGGG
jgi:hypothetical protein